MKHNGWIPILILIALVSVGMVASMSIFQKEKKKTERTSSVSEKISDEKKKEKKEEETQIDFIGILREVDTENKLLIVYNPVSGKEEGYAYDGTTSVKNAFDREIVIKGLALGSILELFFKEGGGLAQVLESKKAWTYKGITNLSIEPSSFSMRIGERNYLYDTGLTVVGDKEVIRLKDVDPSKDVLEVRGIEDHILSIIVTKGHGSLDFQNYDEFIGGSIEIGYDVFDEIKENMTYVLREGTYKVVMENGGLIVNKVVEIGRNRIRLLDLKNLKGTMDKKSRVRFKLSPTGVRLFVDGKEVDTRRELILSYGEYIVKATKEGYLDFEDIMRIEKPKEIRTISLASKDEEEKKETREKSEETKEYEEEENDDGHRTPNEESEEKEEELPEETRVRTDYDRKISVLKPIGATILFDDQVIGVAPCQTTKVTGEHKITVEKDGFQSVSYTVDISDDGEDAVFGFPALTE